MNKLSGKFTDFVKPVITILTYNLHCVDEIANQKWWSYTKPISKVSN